MDAAGSLIARDAELVLPGLPILAHATGVTSGVNLERSLRSPAPATECSERILAAQRPTRVWAERSDPTLNPQVPGSNPGGRTTRRRRRAGQGAFRSHSLLVGLMSRRVR